MFLKSSFFLLICIFNAHATKIELKPDTVPTEFRLLFNDIDSSQHIQYEDFAKIINDSLSEMEKRQVYFIIKSEIYKAILAYEYDSYRPNIILNSKLLNKVRKQFQKNEDNYNSFSKWAIRSFMGDLQYRIGRKQKVDNMTEARFLRPWFHNILTKKPEEFNKMMAKLTHKIFKKISMIAKVFKNHSAPKDNTKTLQFFLFSKSEPQGKKSKTSKESDGTKAVENLIPKQSEIDSEIDKISNEIDTMRGSQWAPKEGELPAPLDTNYNAIEEMEESGWKPR
jgi:hypothetical protein